jgi:hypothetical protein
VIANPTPCRIVLYHFAVLGDDHKHVHISRPAVVTSVGASDDVVSLFVFFEPDDARATPYHAPAPNQLNVHPFNPSSPNTPGWSWPPRA